jgi:hypothetical protein
VADQRLPLLRCALALMSVLAAGCRREEASVAIELDPKSVGAWLDAQEIAVRLESIEASAFWRAPRFEGGSLQPAAPAVFRGLEDGRRYRLVLPRRCVHEPVMVVAAAGERRTVQVPILERGARDDFANDGERAWDKQLYLDLDARQVAWREGEIDVWRGPLGGSSPESVVEKLRTQWLENGQHRHSTDRRFDQLVWVVGREASARELLANARRIAQGVTREYQVELTTALVPAFQLRLLAREDFEPQALPPPPPPLASPPAQPRVDVSLSVSISGRTPQAQAIIDAFQAAREAVAGCLGSGTSGAHSQVYKYFLEPNGALKRNSLAVTVLSSRADACIDHALRSAMPHTDRIETRTTIAVVLNAASVGRK